jgi:hypothetical protein
MKFHIQDEEHFYHIKPAQKQFYYYFDSHREQFHRDKVTALVSPPATNLTPRTIGERFGSRCSPSPNRIPISSAQISPAETDRHSGLTRTYTPPHHRGALDRPRKRWSEPADTAVTRAAIQIFRQETGRSAGEGTAASRSDAKERKIGPRGGDRPRPQLPPPPTGEAV